MNLAPYLVGDLEVCVVEEPSKRVRPPTIDERLILDELYQQPEMYDAATGKPYHLHGNTVAGIDGLVLTYQRPAT